MNWRVLPGILGVVVIYLCITLSIMLSPWFSWTANALSDLGHPAKSTAAPIFNFGLAAGGILVALYAVSAMAGKAKYSAILLAVTGISLTLVGVFNESWGWLHFAVSVVFFSFACLTLFTYSIEMRSLLAALSAIIGLLAWFFFWLDISQLGVAVPELISSLTATAWFLYDNYLPTRKPAATRA